MTIYEALPQIITEIEAIGKTKTNDFHKYKFRGVDDVYSALNMLLGKHGVTIVPEVLDYRSEEVTTQGNKASYRVMMTVKYKLYSNDGTSIDSVVVGEAIDTGDKASPKALSMAYKYMAFQVFCIPTEEKLDTEHESPEITAKREVFATAIDSMTSIYDLDLWIENKKEDLGKLGNKDKEDIKKLINKKKESFK